MISEELNPTLIVAKLEVSSSEEIFKLLGQRFIDAGYTKASYIEALKEREDAFPTGIDMGGYGIAMPHTEPSHVLKNGIGIATLTKPVCFMQMGAEDEPLDVQLVFMVASSEKSHIDLLQALLAVLRDKETVDNLIAAPDEETIVEIIRAKENSK